MPQATELISIDFGKNFQREYDFFTQFNPHILKTNFRELKLDRNSWTFMGAAAILYSEYLGLGFHAFGTIYEATPSHFASNPWAAVHQETEPFSSAGLTDVRYTNGLTEIGTALIAAVSSPDLIQQSLISLANAGTGKRYRKEIIADIINQRFNLGIDIEKGDPPASPYPFGKYLADDFLCFYICKYAGADIASNLTKDIPSEVIEYCDCHKLSLYERINPVFIEKGIWPHDTHGRYLSKLADIGILPYSEQDYIELDEIRSILKKHHRSIP